MIAENCPTCELDIRGRCTCAELAEIRAAASKAAAESAARVANLLPNPTFGEGWPD